MIVVPGLIFALTVMYFWLRANWFARVIAFFVFAAFGVLVGCLVNAGGDHGGIYFMLSGIVLAWPVSGIPIYCQRYKARSTSMEIALR
jgi:hypothetical protein